MRFYAPYYVSLRPFWPFFHAPLVCLRMRFGIMFDTFVPIPSIVCLGVSCEYRFKILTIGSFSLQNVVRINEPKTTGHRDSID